MVLKLSNADNSKNTKVDISSFSKCPRYQTSQNNAEFKVE